MTAVAEEQAAKKQPYRRKNKLQVRSLKARDLIAFVKVIRPHLDLDRINILLSKRDEDITLEDIGVEILQMVLGAVDDDLMAFLAGLCDMTPEEFGDEDINAPLIVLEQVIQGNDIRDFLSQALGMIQSTSRAK